ncbi:sideroflexin [Cavenderia fasciculata]|uniref:Sidoreflexin n=1 Tax=Cavenderia fasciculata TaxID=261658 RepID=F4PI33_CACFS|nr:sideroflexin [Cavenderia fasciculata]EGG25316.1 sideroflexin [Cavenderia fasciculata]|eukprot:XP_004363167.1 sideroflexin [Cavenderia fasciculata]
MEQPSINLNTSTNNSNSSNNNNTSTVSSKMSDIPLFDGHSGRFNNNTFMGRFQNFRDVTDPRSMFVSQVDLQKAKELMEKFKKGSIDAKVESESLWKAKKVIDATVHPDTGETIPLPFRMCSFLPINVIICAGLILPNPSIGTTIFWQWINQSYNIALNHANRNASNAMSNQQVATAYLTAVGISCSLAVGLGKAVDKLKINNLSIHNGIRMLVPFTAVTTAGIANVLVMRSNEMITGIDIKDKDGNIYGKSAVAGKEAVLKVAASRAATSFPALLLPPMVMSVVEKISFIKKYPLAKMPINLAVIAAIFNSSLPAAIAMFPQESSISASDLEPQFRDLKDKNGNIIKEFIYNKGL